jgi:hypothetical protein
VFGPWLLSCKQNILTSHTEILNWCTSLVTQRKSVTQKLTPHSKSRLTRHRHGRGNMFAVFPSAPSVQCKAEWTLTTTQQQLQLSPRTGGYTLRTAVARPPTTVAVDHLRHSAVPLHHLHRVDQLLPRERAPRRAKPIHDELHCHNIDDIGVQLPAAKLTNACTRRWRAVAWRKRRYAHSPADRTVSQTLYC